MARTRRLTHSPSLRPTVCVVGAGHGGLAMAGVLALDGFRVRLLNRSPERLAPVRAGGGITVNGTRRGFAPIDVATTDPAVALEGAAVVMVVVPASGHRTIATLCAPHLRDGQIVVLNPGRTFGAIDFEATARRAGCRAALRIAEAQTFLFASRVVAPGRARLFGIKRAVALATIDPEDRDPCLASLRRLFPQLVPASSMLETSLDNQGAVFHPALTLYNAERIERGERFEIYREGISNELARVLEAVDGERLALAAALGVPARSARTWLHDVYGCSGVTLADAMRANPSYRGIAAPSTTRMRYITEDVPCGLVPMSSLGRLLGVATPTLDALIARASTLHDRDYGAEGRRVETLGLDHAALQQLHRPIAVDPATRHRSAA